MCLQTADILWCDFFCGDVKKHLLIPHREDTSKERTQSRSRLVNQEVFLAA